MSETATCQSARAVRVGNRWRWECEGCGEAGDIGTKASAETGAGYHAYAVRPMTVSEFRSMGDGMNAGASDEEAAARVAEWNARYAR